MKKKYFITAGIIVCIVLYYMTIRKNYTENFLEVEDRWMGITGYYYFYDTYAYYNNLELPQTLEPIMEEQKKFADYIKDPEHINYIIYYYFKDFLSREKPGLIHYIPLYNSHNMKREGYILLSAGIDGKINNRYDWSDTLFISDFKNEEDIQKKLKLYEKSNLYTDNLDDIAEYIEYSDTGLSFYDPDNKYRKKILFNIFNYFFGKKDILIASKNYVENYKNKGKSHVYNLDELIKDIEYKPNPLRDNYFYRYKGAFQKDTFIDNDRYVFFRHNEYLIRNKLHNGSDLILYDTITFVGITNDFDKENKIIDFKNCIQVFEEELN